MRWRGGSPASGSRLVVPRRDFLAYVGGLACCAALAGCAPKKKAAPKKKEEHAEEHVKHWGYEGEVGPRYWADLDPTAEVCKLGRTQSPVDVTTFKDNPALGVLKIDYTESKINLVNNGHTIQFNYGPGSILTVNGRPYELVQFHFHTPSEHTINGAFYPLETHLVHKDGEGRLAVLGLMMRQGNTNEVLDAFWNNLPLKQGEFLSKDLINVKQMLPADARYFTYEGSLTTPPCSEGVRWLLLKQPVHAGEAQIDKFASIFPKNARPVQPLQGRTIEGSIK